jgi:hypothetical protein
MAGTSQSAEDVDTSSIDTRRETAVESQTLVSENIIRVSSSDPSIPEAYHLDGISNYGVWSHRMKHALQRDALFNYCITPPSQPMGVAEATARSRVQSIFHNNAKNMGLKLLKRYNDPYVCWTALKRRYESNSGPRKNKLIEQFFSLRKTNSISTDAHLTEVKNVADQLEETGVVLPESIIVYYTIDKLPSKYEICRRMLLNADQLPDFETLEA